MKRLREFMRTSRRLRNYLGERLRALTWRKALNATKTEWEFLRRKTVLKSYPYEIVIDPTNICQLQCPLCPTGSRTSSRPRGSMNPETFTKILDEIGRYAVHIYLHNWGESLLHRDIIGFIGAAKRSRAAVSLSTNLSFPLSNEKADSILLSGLDTLVISLDGTTKETYSRYRIAGDSDRVISNMRLLAQRKRALGLKRPFLEWQFLVMRHNAHEVADAKRIGREIGVDNVAFGTVVLPFGVNEPSLAAEWFTDEEMKGRTRYDVQERDMGRTCWWLWRGVVFNWDGSVYPCCYIDGEEAVFGNINETPFREIWNNEAFLSARSLFSGKRPVRGTICGRCGIVAGRRA